MESKERHTKHCQVQTIWPDLLYTVQCTLWGKKTLCIYTDLADIVRTRIWKRILIRAASVQNTNNFFASQYCTRVHSLFVFVVRYSSSEEGGAIDIRSGSTSTISTGRRRTDRLTDNRYRSVADPGCLSWIQIFFHLELRSRISISDPGFRSRIPDPKRTTKKCGGEGVLFVLPFFEE